MAPRLPMCHHVSGFITISLFPFEDEKIRAVGELCRGKEGRGATLLRSVG